MRDSHTHPDSESSKDAKQTTDGIGRRIGRRRLLQAAGASGALAIAGCLSSGGGSGMTTLTMYTSTESTSAYQISQAIAAVMDEHSDSVAVDARPSDGAKQSMRLLDQGDADIAYTDVMNAYNIFNEDGEYAENSFEHDIRQLWHYYALQENLVVRGDSDIGPVTDLAGKKAATGSAGSALKTTFRSAFDHAGIKGDVEHLSIDFDQEPSALSSGQTDAITDIRINGATPSYVEQQYSTNENARVVHWPSNVRDAISNDPKLNGEVYPADEMGGPSYGMPDGKTRSEEFWLLTSYVTFTRSNVDDAAIEELLTTIYANTDQLADAQALTTPWGDIKSWVDKLSPAIPVHAGAQEFYDDQGADYPTP
ncbi:TAXI family TRAP transporter solute-binding subunit [Halobacteriales archaeon Cl-PHB]